MKKLIFTLAISLTTIIAANAQEIGQFWLGGSFGFWTEKATGGGESLTNFQFLPELGYAVNDDIGVGIRLGYRSEEYFEVDDYYYEKERINTFIISPFVRWAFLKGHFGGLFLDAGAGYAYGSKDDSDYSTQEFEIGLRPGVAINVSHSVSLTGKFGFAGYRHLKEGWGGDNNYHTNSFGINLDMSQFLVGAVVKF